MKALLAKLTFFFVCLFAYTSATSSTHNNLMPQQQVFLTPTFSNGSQAFSFLGEVGNKNFRGNATYGASIGSCQRLKLSGEYLLQDLNYRFFTTHKRAWVSQVGVGGTYEYLFKRTAFQSVDANFSYSHAFNRHLGSKAVFIDGQNFTINRRVAGSDAFLSHLGTTLSLWHCAFLSLYGNYDHVTYHRQFRQESHVEGFGGSAEFTQQFAKEFNLALTAQWRKPFNFFQAVLNWNRLYDCWGITCGLYGSYTKGKEHLPNVAMAGIQLGFTFGGKKANCCCRTFENCCSSSSENCYDRLFCNLANWVSKPAIYSPVVLAISDPQAVALASACTPPTSIPIPNQIFNGGPPYSFDASPFFNGNGSPLTFSATGLPVGSSIDPITGVISGNSNVASSTATITATSPCGSTSQTVSIAFEA